MTKHKAAAEHSNSSRPNCFLRGGFIVSNSGRIAGRMPENRLQGRFLREEKTHTCAARFRHSTHALAGIELFLQNLQIASPWTPKRCKFCRGNAFRENVIRGYRTL